MDKKRSSSRAFPDKGEAGASHPVKIPKTPNEPTPPNPLLDCEASTREVEDYHAFPSTSQPPASVGVAGDALAAVATVLDGGKAEEQASQPAIPLSKDQSGSSEDEESSDGFDFSDTDSKEDGTQIEAPAPLTNTGMARRWAKTIQKVKLEKYVIKAFHSSSGRKTTLCPQCAKLNLDFDSFVIPSDAVARDSPRRGPSFYGERPMGTLTKILERTNCPLCDLLVRSLGKDFDPEEEGNPSCNLVWTQDGMERVADSHDLIHRTRRLQIVWKRTSRVEVWKETHEKSYIVLIAPMGKFNDKDSFEDNGVVHRSTLFLGRLLTSVTGKNVSTDSVDLAVRWLSVCTNSHGDQCGAETSLRQRAEYDLLRSPYFAVVDVDRMCLAALPRGEGFPKYVAMSYTWGPDTEAKERFRRTNDNSFLLQKEKGITLVLKGLPKAIRQAIKLTRRLKIKYLWVDSLCIIQDNDWSWSTNAAIMDVIYGNAALTICAADNDSAKYGLKALNQKDSRYTRQADEYHIEYCKPDGGKPLHLLLSHPSESYIACSRWDHRGWTLQERLLSPRCLIFVGGRMYFQCRTTTMSEDIYSDEPIAGWSVELYGSPALTLKKLRDRPITVYQDLVKRYNSRYLTKENDVLDAFKGVKELIEESLGDGSLGDGCKLVYGLPSSHFDWALLWSSDRMLTRRTDGKEEHRATKDFPSWSWCGWKGEMVVDAGWQGSNGMYYSETIIGSDAEFNLHEWLQYYTWIAYYISNGKGRLRLVWDPLRHKPNEELRDGKGYRSPSDWTPPNDKDALAPKYDMHGRPFNRQLPIQGRVAFAERHFKRRLPLSQLQTIVLDAGHDYAADFKNNHTPPFDETYLQFFTWSAKFFLVKPDTDYPSRKAPGPGLTRFTIVDGNGTFAGTCVLDDSWSTAADQRIPQEFIALSYSRRFALTECETEVYYNGPHTETEWQLYNVMMLEYREDDRYNIGYRAGLGKVFTTAFSKSLDQPDAIFVESQGMYWKEIVLG